MAKKSKIQALIINYLEKFGSINIALPDGMQIAIGITQEKREGVVKDPDYCWVIANRENKYATLDRYSMALKFDIEDCCIISEDIGSVEVV